MAMDYKRYPANWKQFSEQIRFIRAGGRCECEGECGRDHRGRCSHRHGQIATSAHQRPEDRRLGVQRRYGIVLTVAHLWRGLCRCAEKCAREDHVKAMCQGCHLRYDKEQHRAVRMKNRHRKLGILSLFDQPAE